MEHGLLPVTIKGTWTSTTLDVHTNRRILWTWCHVYCYICLFHKFWDILKACRSTILTIHYHSQSNHSKAVEAMKQMVANPLAVLNSLAQKIKSLGECLNRVFGYVSCVNKLCACFSFNCFHLFSFSEIYDRDISMDQIYRQILEHQFAQCPDLLDNVSHWFGINNIFKTNLWAEHWAAMIGTCLPETWTMKPYSRRTIHSWSWTCLS